MTIKASKRGGSMTDKKVWFITGAGRGMGVHIAKAALAAGSAVVATGRNTATVIKAVGKADDLLVVKLDVTSPEDAAAAVTAAVDRFGSIDVLVNNAGNFYAGFFEEITPQDFRAQVETLLFGPMNVTRAVLPVMRAQRSGLVVTISSTAGIRGGEFLSAYAASKFGVEGWMESLTPEVAPFGIRTMLVEPGFFRPELLTPESTVYAEPSIDDYAERTRQTIATWNSMNGQQGGDPAKLAAAIVRLAGQDETPLRFVAGADAIDQGMLYTTHAALPHLLQAAEGGLRRVADIVNISSIAGRVAWNGYAVYNLTKFGVNGFTEALRQEVTQRHVRVGVLEPGGVATELGSHNNPQIREEMIDPL